MTKKRKETLDKSRLAVAYRMVPGDKDSFPSFVLFPVAIPKATARCVLSCSKVALQRPTADRVSEDSDAVYNIYCSIVLFNLEEGIYLIFLITFYFKALLGR